MSLHLTQKTSSLVFNAHVTDNQYWTRSCGFFFFLQLKEQLICYIASTLIESVYVYD